jgi:chorismate synthase
MKEDGTVAAKTNHHGGILGGITSGMPIVMRVAIKPTPSIAKEQDTVSLVKKANDRLIIEGRHDPCIVHRAVPCLESIMAIAIADKMV